MKAAVIGSPISHSLSPAIFEFISVNQGKNIQYEAMEVRPEELSKFLSKKKKSNELVGVNVTLPLKEGVINDLDSLSPSAKAIGAVNVVHFNHGQAHGHNTDVIGIEMTFQKMNFQVKDTICLLWGAGGSAKAVAYVLGKLNANTVYIYNRSVRRQELAQTFSLQFPKTSFKAVTSLEEVSHEIFSLMINTTPLGMQGQESGENYFAGINQLNFSPKALAFDLIYIPEVTDFLKASQKKGLQTINGLGMLIDQALATWEIWIGPLNTREKLHEQLGTFLKGLLKLRHESSPLYLTGFMGAGKTTVGRKLSQIIKKEFVDTDQMIESQNKISIPEIFAKYGEDEFRKLEKQVVRDVSARGGVIVSLGGGTLKQEENIKIITNNGKLIYLEADPATLEKRILDQGFKRPLLDGLTDNERLLKISDLLNEREDAYSKAHLRIKTTELNPAQVCFAIISKLGEQL